MSQNYYGNQLQLQPKFQSQSNRQSKQLQPQAYNASPYNASPYNANNLYNNPNRNFDNNNRNQNQVTQAGNTFNLMSQAHINNNSALSPSSLPLSLPSSLPSSLPPSSPSSLPSSSNKYQNNPNNQIINFNQNNYNYNYDGDGDGHRDSLKNSTTSDLYQDSRASFIRKVYTILSLQLILTALICVWAMKSEWFRNVFGSVAAVITLSVLLIALSIAIGCCPNFFKKYGLPLVIIFTLIFALMIGVICSRTKPQIVLTATAITALVVIALTAYACITKTDLTGCGPFLLIFLLILLVFGIMCIFWRNPIVHLIYACLAALVYGIYLIFDTQLVLGKFENAYSLDDAYFAAIQLYIDIIQLFLQILQILSYASN